MDIQRARNRTILKKSKGGGVTLQEDTKTYLKCITKQCSDWYKNKQLNKWNILEGPKIDLHIYSVCVCVCVCYM